MGNDELASPQTIDSQGGWFGTVSNNLANLIGVATPLITALSTKGSRTAEANASEQAAAQKSSQRMFLVIGAGALLLIGVLALVFMRRGR